MKNFNFIFLRLSFYLIAGILSAFYFSVDPKTVFLLFTAAFLFLLFAYFRAQKQIFTDLLPGLSSFLMIFSLGVFIMYYSIPGNRNSHYLNHLNTEALLIASVSEEFKSTPYQQRFIIEVQDIFDNAATPVTGKILLNVQKDSTSVLNLKPGNLILIPFETKELNSPLNPFQFSYKDYLQKLKIERQISLPATAIHAISSRNNLSSEAWNIREDLLQNLKSSSLNLEQLSIFQALILGKRSDISDNLYKSYAAAGAIHILAISGLHIGILLLLLNYIFDPFKKLRYGSYIKPLMVIFLLWGFALLTGMSPSVVRAVTMFSFLAVEIQLKRKTSILNSIFLSLFFLLLIDPYYIFQVGFQLSYLAVLSIVIFQPIIYKLYVPKYQIIDYFWKLISVSIAAQIGILPLSLFYFHQFPGLFLITNVIVLPFLGILLIGGILIILLAKIGFLPGFLVLSYGFLLDLLNRFVEFIGNFEAFVFKDIRFSFLQNLSVYIIIICLLFLIRKPKFHRLFLLLMSILVFQIATFYGRFKISTSEAIVFHKTRESIIGVRNNGNLSLYQNNQESAVIQDYKRERKISEVRTERLPFLVNFSGKKLLVIDSMAVFDVPNLNVDIILLRNSPKLNPERLFRTLHPDLIVADGSNYTSYVQQWEFICRNKKIPFHYTGEKGAYILKND